MLKSTASKISSSRRSLYDRRLGRLSARYASAGGRGGAGEHGVVRHPFDGTWATGLRQLLALLEREGAPKSESANVSAVMDWYARSIDSQRQAVVSNDKYLSNWFRLRLPKRLYSRQFSDCGFVKGGVALSIRGHGSLRGRACCPPHNGVRG